MDLVRIDPKGDEALRMGQGGWIYAQTYIQVDRQILRVLSDFVFFGAAA